MCPVLSPVLKKPTALVTTRIVSINKNNRNILNSATAMRLQEDINRIGNYFTEHVQKMYFEGKFIQTMKILSIFTDHDVKPV